MADTLTDFAAEREAMVQRQIDRRGIHDPKILEAFRAVPREKFMSEDYADLAYGDHPLPIEAGQTISQPYIVALMIQAGGTWLPLAAARIASNGASSAKPLVPSPSTIRTLS